LLRFKPRREGNQVAGAVHIETNEKDIANMTTDCNTEINPTPEEFNIWLLERRLKKRTPREESHYQIGLIAKWHSVTLEDILGDSRERYIVNARAECAIHFKAQGKSYPEIGRILNRDHTSIAYLCGALTKNKVRAQGKLCNPIASDACNVA
jgi:chromosomal replication initiation ATPase DnaA